jgi:hypothetical protein
LNARTYKWLVARGTITVARDLTHVAVEADPEGSAYCVMTAQDANEIAGIITEQARALWDASDKLPESQASVEGDARSSKLKTASGVVSLIAHESKPLIALSYDGQGAFLLNVTQAVALVQLIEHMLRELSAA